MSVERELEELRARVERLEASVNHPGDRVHEILRLKRAGRNEEARRLMHKGNL
jgi:hypothetical protein